MTPVRFPPDLTDLLVPIDQVRPHPHNPNAADIDAIIEAIEIEGFHTPVIAQTSTGYLLDGNHRHAALLSMGATHIPVVYMAVDDTSAYRILLGTNRLCRIGRDDPALTIEIADILADTPLGLAGTGWLDVQIDALRAAMAPLTFDETEPVKQRTAAITCPACGHEFGGSARSGRVTPASEVYR